MNSEARDQIEQLEARIDNPRWWWIVDGLIYIGLGVLLLWLFMAVPFEKADPGSVIGFVFFVLFVSGIWSVGSGIRTLARRGR
jgi:hypothetical protein